MKHTLLLLASLALVVPLATAADGPATPTTSSWPQWRGPLATGVAPDADPPLRWSESENVRWKVPIPGRGHASPIVWKDQVFLLAAVPVAAAGDGETSAPSSERRRGVAPAGPIRFTVIALDRGTGETAWQRVAREETPHEGTHTDGTWASASAVTDGEVLIAHFGSRGLYAYSLDGELLWSKDLGDMQTRRGFGEGSSPALTGDLVVVNWDHEGDSFIVALDKATGDEVWRRERDEMTSWATPIVVESAGREQVIVSATGRVRGYDVATGELLWVAGGQTVNVIPSPVYGNGLVYAASGFRGSALQAIRLADARGDLTGTSAVIWSHDRDTPYVPSLLLYGEQIYFLKVNTGILTSLDAATGETRFGPERLPGVDGVYASPVAAAGRVYIIGRNGNTLVLRHGPELDIMAQNSLDDDFSASPALAGDELFLRGHRYLYCLTEVAGER